MIDEIYELVVGEDGLVVTLRCENKLDEKKYDSVKYILHKLVEEWKMEKVVPLKALMACLELVEALTGGSRFLDEAESIKVEDASIEIKDIINELYLII